MVVQERRQRLEGRAFGGLPSAGSASSPAAYRSASTGGTSGRRAPAPHAADGGLGSLMLVQVARAPGREPQRLVALELGRILVRRRQKVRPHRPWRTPLRAEWALPASLAGPADRAPFRREASDWAGEGVVGMAGSGGWTRQSIAHATGSVKEL